MLLCAVGPLCGGSYITPWAVFEKNFVNSLKVLWPSAESSGEQGSPLPISHERTNFFKACPGQESM